MVPPLTQEMLQKRINDNQMDLSSLRLDKIPFELIWRCIGNEARITKMNLANNLLTSLPPQFCTFFPDVEVLNLHHNKIRRIPDNIGTMTSLRRLNLSHNQIKKLPNSFADLEQLEWFNLAHNPLSRDLSKIIGNCSNDAQCAKAARNAVQYAHFSATLASESTTIEEDTSMPTNDSSSSSPDSAEYRNHREFEQKQKYRRKGGQQNSISNSRLCSSGTIFVLVLFSLTALGIPLWLTLDSIRANCVYEEYSNPAERQFCIDVAKMFTNGAFPASSVQFLHDFSQTFKSHWSLVIDAHFMEKVKAIDWHQLGRDANGWAKVAIAKTKLAARIVWDALLQPIFSFLSDYFFDLWHFYIRPTVQQAWSN